jgi:hypothetical protein
MKRISWVFAVLWVGIFCFSHTATGGTITLNVINPSQVVGPTSTETYQGTITNLTGADLLASDFFFDFAGYDPVLVNLTQLLGTPDFPIPNGTTSAAVDLFTFALGPDAPPGVYLADVVLQDSQGDVSNVVTLSETVVPEPGTWVFIGSGLLALLLSSGFTRRLSSGAGAFPAALVLALVVRSLYAAASPVILTTGAPGASLISPTMYSAVPIVNAGTATASNVLVTFVTIQSGTLISGLPISLGSLPVGGRATLFADFTGAGLLPGGTYRMTAKGTYRVGSTTYGFTVNSALKIPPASPGSAASKTTTVTSKYLPGPFPHQPLGFSEKENGAGWTVPTGPFVSGTPTPSSTGTQMALIGSSHLSVLAGAVTFNVNNGLGLTSGSTNGTASTVAEPSGGANGGGLIFATANWIAAVSTDGGSTWTQYDPTTIFPNDAVGFCCDQVVQYVPSIDRFIWLIQGANGDGYRLAAASPSDIATNIYTAWTYWNLTPDVFGQPAGTGLDYPDLSVGNNYLYMSWDNGWNSCPTGCSSGREIARVKLSDIQAGGTIGINYTTPSDSSVAWGSHLMQDTQDEIFWAGHENNGQTGLRVFSWAESSGTYYWRSITVASWANNSLSSTTPDGKNWLAGSGGFPGNSVIGATRSLNNLWFAWTAGTNSNFQQPHVEMVTLDRSNNFNLTQQVQIWNNSYAFAYPALATNACTAEVGLSLEYGGNGNYENHVVGFWGDFVVYITTASDVGTTRYGDYVTIRQDPASSLNGGFFDAFGYGLNTPSPPGTGTQTDVHYVLFGRQRCITQ